MSLCVRSFQPSDVSLLDMSVSMPVDLSLDGGSGLSAAALADLHHAAGAEADSAIAEAEHESLLMETDSIAAAAGSASKWDDSVPEVHLRSFQPDDILSTELETVDHLEHSRASLTKEELTAPLSLMAAFPRSSPAILGEDNSFLQHQMQQQIAQQAAQQAAQQQQVQVVVVSQADASQAAASESNSASESDSESESSILTEAEAAAGVVTMSDLQQMMELEGMSQAEIDQYMENLGHTVVDVEADAEADAAVEADAEQAAATEGEQEAEATTEADTETESEASSETETDGESDADAAHEAELAAYAKDAAESGVPAATLLEIEHQAQAEEEARLAAEAENAEANANEEQPALVESNAAESASSDAESDADASSETESTMASDMDAASEVNAEVDVSVDVDATMAADAAAPPHADDDVIHLKSHAAPAVLQEAVPSVVTPIHSRAFAKRHPTLNRIAQHAAQPSGYSLPQPTAMVETHSRSRLRSYQRARQEDLDTTKFNPSAIQLGPSKDVYGYVPMTGAEFLQSPQQGASLAQVSMQMQHQSSSWLPPPIESQAVPNFVVGVGGLMPNRIAGPYQGQYGLAAGGQPLPEQPAFIQY